MNVEKRVGIIFIRSELTDSLIRIERQPDDTIAIVLASRDNDLVMQIETQHVPLNDISNLPEYEWASYRSPTADERREMNLDA